MQPRQENYTCGADQAHPLQVLPHPISEAEKMFGRVVGAAASVFYSRTKGIAINRVINVKTTEGGRQALLKLAKRGMRRMLTVLQARHAAYDLVDETEAHDCTYCTTRVSL